MENRFFRYGALVAVALVLGHVLWLRSRPEQEQNESGVLLILELFVIAILGGVLFVTWILPSLSDKVTEAVLSSGEKEEKTPRAIVAELLAEEDYEGAIAELQKQSLQNPSDRRLVMDMAWVYRDKLQDLPSAVQTIRTALVSREWSPENETALRAKLAELLAEQKDFAGAKQELETVMQKFAGTPQAGEAASKLRDIEEKEYLAKREG